jgi:hypothetical protein
MHAMRNTTEEENQPSVGSQIKLPQTGDLIMCCLSGLSHTSVAVSRLVCSNDGMVIIRGKPTKSKKNLLQRLFIQNKCNMKSPGIEPRTPT